MEESILFASFIVSDGQMIGTIHPPSFSWMVNQDTKSPAFDLMIFLSSRNQLCQGRWLVRALLPRPFQSIGTSKKFSCQLILVMGVKAPAKSLLNRQIDLYYYRMRRDLNQLYIPNLMKRSFNPKHFLLNLFESSLIKVSKKHIFMCYLNQISGPTLEGWKLQPSTDVVEGAKYHQCRMGPDQLLQRAPIFKEYERSVQLNDTQFSDWKIHKHHYYTIYNDNIGIVTGSSHLSQFYGGSVLVTYSLRQKTCRK
jgi:hypothetical protein